MIRRRARDRALAITRELDDALAQVHDLARTGDSAGPRWGDPDFELACGLERAVLRTQALTRALIREPDLDDALTRAVGSALTGDLADLHHTITGRLDRAVTRALTRVFETAGELAVALPSHDEAGEAGRAGLRGKGAVTGSAGRLVAVVMRLLPSADRTRYAEEFRAELWDLAETRAGRWRQISYAARLLTRVWELRRELTAPHPRKASW